MSREAKKQNTNIIKKKKKIQKTFCERYKSIFEEGNNKKQQYGREQYQNLSDYEKQNLVEYRNRYYEM